MASLGLWTPAFKVGWKTFSLHNIKLCMLHHSFTTATVFPVLISKEYIYCSAGTGVKSFFDKIIGYNIGRTMSSLGLWHSWHLQGWLKDLSITQQQTYIQPSDQQLIGQNLFVFNSTTLTISYNMPCTVTQHSSSIIMDSELNISSCRPWAVWNIWNTGHSLDMFKGQILE